MGSFLFFYLGVSKLNKSFIERHQFAYICECRTELKMLLTQMILQKKINKKLCAMHAIACCCQIWCVFLCCHSFSDFSRRYMRGNGIIKASSRYKQYLRLQPKIPTLHETGFSFPSFEHYFENFRTFSKGLKFWFFQALPTFPGYAGYPALNCLWKWLKICKIVLIRLVL